MELLRVGHGGRHDGACSGWIELEDYPTGGVEMEVWQLFRRDKTVFRGGGGAERDSVGGG